MAGMQQNGLAKLTEETGELQQVVGKMLQYPELQSPIYAFHPDGTILRDRIEEEAADVLAAIEFVIWKMQLNRERIKEMQAVKYLTFKGWDAEGN